MRRRRTLFALVVATLFCLPLVYAEQLDIYRQIKELTPYFGGGDKKFFFSSDYELSFIRFGATKTHWQLLTERFMYFVKGQIPYVEFNWHRRGEVTDLTVDGGSYFRFKNSNLHVKTGFGLDADFIYRFQLQAEYEHRLYKGLYGKIGSRYLHYQDSETVIFTPAGLSLYYGNHYLTADYNFSITEGRADAHWATVKAYLLLHPRLMTWVGVAAGQRLFDIQALDSQKQGGVIIFSGAEWRLSENIKAHAGYSYSEEKPNFLKRSIEGGLTVRF